MHTSDKRQRTEKNEGMFGEVEIVENNGKKTKRRRGMRGQTGKQKMRDTDGIVAVTPSSSW